MTDTTMSLLPAALRIAERRGMKVAPGLDEFGLRACRPDFTSRNGFRWPFPGCWADAGGPFSPSTAACPIAPGDGLCVAYAWDGLASGGIAAHLVLLVGWKKSDVLGRNAEKARVKRVFVVDALTVRALLEERSEEESADLHGANLRGADLYGADLYGANLRGADLRGADLHGANLYGANLYGADLYGADLRGANLHGANRDYAKARGAYVS